MGKSQPGIPVRRMAVDRKTKVTDALVRIQKRPAHAKPDFSWLYDPEMEPESAHVVSAVSVPSSNVAICDAAPPRQHSPIFATPRYSATPCCV